jgi:hypothetical protein
MSNYDQATRDRLQRAQSEHLKLRAFGRTGPRCCYAQYDGGWRVRIGETPNCTCPDFQHRRCPCKHILKTILRILGGETDLAVQATLTEKQLTALFQPNAARKALSKSNNGKKRKAVSSHGLHKRSKGHAQTTLASWVIWG